MAMIWPGFLILLVLIPLLIAAYIWILARKRKFAIRYSSLELVRQALGKHSRLRRHVPFALFILGIASLVLAMSRPQAILSLPAGQSTIILAVDVSRSMCQSDIKPNRLEAAKRAALKFIESQKRSTQIGIVAFGGFAELVQEPTTDQEALSAAIRRLRATRRTAIGSAILESLDAIADEYEDAAPANRQPLPITGMESPLEDEYAPYVIVLLTDGVSNTGPDPLEAAQEASQRGVRIYTIGFGTAGANGPIPPCGGDGGQPGDPFGFGGQGFGGGGGFRRGIDEVTLQQVSNLTGAQYYPAESAEQLQEVFDKLPTHPIIHREFMEISSLFSSLGALFALLALVLSWLWNPTL